MNNIQKAFKEKAKLGMRRAYADGGVVIPTQQPVTPTIDTLSLGGGQTYGDLKNMDRLTAAQYTNDPEILNAAMDREPPKRYIDYSPQPVANTRAQGLQPQQQVAPKNPLPTVSQPPETMLGQNGLLGLRQAKSPSGYANGGTVDGKGFIHGQKGIDKVAGEVAETGEPIRVGDGERIVNKSQNAALEALTAQHGIDLDDYLARSTGEPVGPTTKQGLRAAVLGGEFGSPVMPSELQPWAREPVTTMELAEPSGRGAAGRATAMGNQAKAAMNNMPNQPNMGPQQAPLSEIKVTPTPQTAAAAKAAGGMSPEAAAYQASTQPAQTAAATESAVANQTSKLANLRNAINGSNATTVGDLFSGASKAAAKVGPRLANFARAGAPVAGVEGAVRGLNTDNSEYAQRMGVDEPDSMLGGLALRAAGVMSDVGAGAINGAALLPNLVTHGLDFNKWYDHRNNFDDVKAAQAKQIVTQPAATKPAAQPAAAPATAQVAEPVVATAPGRAAGTANYDDTQQSEALGDFADKLTGVSRAGNQGLRGLAQRLDAYQNNEGARTARNAQLQARGDGTRFDKDANGKIVITNSGDFDGSTKAPYTDAEGKPTKDWSKTTQYAQGLAQAKKDTTTLDSMQRDRARRDAFDDSITDPNARANGLRAMAMYEARDNKAAELGIKKAAAEMEVARFNQHERDTKQMQANNVRDFDQKEEDGHNAKVNDLLKSWATTDGKLDNQKHVALTKYAAQFARTKDKNGKLPSSEQALKTLMDNYAVDSLFEDQGRHWSSPETSWSGEAAQKIQKGTAGMGAWVDGRMQGQTSYRDPATNRTIYESDVTRNLSPDQLEMFKARLAK